MPLNIQIQTQIYQSVYRQACLYDIVGTGHISRCSDCNYVINHITNSNTIIGNHVMANVTVISHVTAVPR